ncbi:S-adenosyl-L-methionine-dependent methyltransferase [Lasiosphaeria hispida]|uniref:S-adenosyl-L-methionine-dependent methyltransferase n=1 Tax=Lasiosphaeria hispida TaxID=260671 RepID=A0AAJ0HKN6_9PEZI|nr:S-adenosyl-L-methionine-dependent methyltransferase [Lasiosphaeria hispida]
MVGGPAEAPAPEQSKSRSEDILPGARWQSVLDAKEANGACLALHDETDSSTASVTSSILQYRELYGRTYHSDRGNAQYWAANDTKQNEALDIQHHMLTLHINGKLYLAPLEDIEVKRVLDIGCGTGIWAMDFADEFPDAQVIGTDISPIQPTWVPPNVKFEIEDCTQSWTFPDNSFDYIHIRWMVGSIPDWSALFEEAYRVLRPGGYLESFEPQAVMESDDGSIKPTDAMGQWAFIFHEGGRKTGRPFTILKDDLQQKGMKDAGFVDVQEKNLKTPLGTWPHDPKLKELGQYVQLVIEQDTEGYILLLATTLGWTREDVLSYIAQLLREIQSGTKRGYIRQKVIWGRKPGPVAS